MLQYIIAGVIIAAAVILSVIYLFRMFRGAVKGNGDCSCNCADQGNKSKSCGQNEKNVSK